MYRLLIFFLSLTFSLFTFYSSLLWAEATIQLDKVVITATRIEERAENVAQDITIITREEIEEGSYFNITDALKNVIGIHIRENGNRGASASLRVRGSTAEQVLVLLDGKRLNKPADGQVDLNAIPVTLEQIERIEVLRGASSALYGADAMGGVVNIITKAPSEPVTKVSLSYGRFDTWDASIMSSRKIGRSGYLFAAHKEESAGFRENDDYDVWGVNGKLTYDITKDVRIDLNIDHNKKKAGVPGSLDWLTPDARQRDENTIFGMTFKAHDTITKLYSHHSKINYLNPPFEDSTHKNHVHGADIQSSFVIGSSNIITGGIELITEEIDSTDIGTRSRTRKGIFIQDEIAFGDTVSFILGLRYDDFEKGNRITPRAALLYRIFKHTAIRVTAGQGYRIPTLNDLYWPDFGWAVGNPNLRPEESEEFELSIEQFFSDTIKAKALFFHKDVDDLIRWDEVEPGRWIPENIEDARIRGFEFIAQMNARPMDIEASYYYQDPDNRNTDKKIPDLPRHQIKGIVSAYPFKGTTLSLEGRYVSNYVLPGTSKWSYFVLDGKFSKKLKLSFGEGELFIIGKNILDRKYETSRDYPMPPVEISGGVAITF